MENETGLLNIPTSVQLNGYSIMSSFECVVE